MPVMKQLTVDGTTYTTVGEVTVTQSLGSGTQVGSIDVDGTSTTLYAPTPTTYTLPTASTSTLGGVKVDGSTITIADGVISASGGGGSVEPSTTAPAMDGTAAAGTSVKYARADHVHPTDTSRQATLVSGTNIKTINGNSLLGSGDLTVGGGAAPTTAAVTLTANGWGGGENAQTATVQGVTVSSAVIVAPAPTYEDKWVASKVICAGQSPNTLRFTCTSIPTENITVNVLVF